MPSWRSLFRGTALAGRGVRAASIVVAVVTDSRGQKNDATAARSLGLRVGHEAASPALLSRLHATDA